jgi:hypothetical protein
MHHSMTSFHQRRQQEQKHHRQPVGVQKIEKIQVLHEGPKGHEVQQAPEFSGKMQVEQAHLVPEGKVVQEQVVRVEQDHQDGMPDEDPVVPSVSVPDLEIRVQEPEGHEVWQAPELSDKLQVKQAHMVFEEKSEQRQVIQIEQDLQDGISDKDPMVPSVSAPDPEPMNRAQEPLPKQVTKESVPFEIEEFRRSVAAQRSTREIILEASRLARPSINLNWRKLTKMFPDLKSVETIATFAKNCHRYLSEGSSRSDLITAFSSTMSKNFEQIDL